MCGRFSLSFTDKIIEELFDVELEAGENVPSFNCAPSQNLAVITNENKRKLNYFRWGLIPSWAKDASIGYKMINAKAETIFEKPAFRNAIRSRRCLVPADSFYEWKQDGAKTPFRIMMRNDSPITMAGIWEKWQDASGRSIFSFSVLTTDANEMMKELHHRMPVIIDLSNKQNWLEAKSEEEISAFLKPFPSELMKAYPVSKLVNSPGNNSAAIHKPAIISP